MNTPNSQPVLIGERSSSHDHLYNLLWICSNRSTASSYWGPQSWSQYSVRFSLEWNSHLPQSAGDLQKHAVWENSCNLTQKKTENWKGQNSWTPVQISANIWQLHFVGLLFLKVLTSLWRVKGRPKAESVSWESLDGRDPVKSESKAGSLRRKKVTWEEVCSRQKGRWGCLGPCRIVFYEQLQVGIGVYFDFVVVLLRFVGKELLFTFSIWNK